MYKCIHFVLALSKSEWPNAWQTRCSLNVTGRLWRLSIVPKQLVALNTYICDKDLAPLTTAMAQTTPTKYEYDSSKNQASFIHLFQQQSLYERFQYSLELDNGDKDFTPLATWRR